MTIYSSCSLLSVHHVINNNVIVDSFYSIPCQDKALIEALGTNNHKDIEKCISDGSNVKLQNLVSQIL